MLHVAKKNAGREATPGLARLVEAGVEHIVHSYTHDEAASADLGYGLEAAHALGVEPDRVFKTLMVMAGSRRLLAVVPVKRQLDVKAMAHAVGAKQVTLAPREVAERVSGSVVGGISPLGGRTPLAVVIDESATAYATVLVSAGRRGMDVELSPGDLLRVTAGSTAPIAR